MTRPRLLDLFCCAGGAGKGYHDAGFDVVGVDINPQKNYPFMFIQADALEFIKRNGRHFDAIHASPPCQRYSAMSACRPGLAEEYPDLVGATRDALDGTGLPYVIENVPRAPLRADLMLCGRMFGRALYRHRIFESNIPLAQPDHPKHVTPGGRAGHWKPGQIISISGNCSPIGLAREVMGIDWTNRRELAESIPPYYTEHIGRQLIEHVARRAAA
jgi:DNA (cytosine-5)-methyltransferase 1